MNWAQRMKAEREQLQREILNFRLHLLSSKFTGSELVCPDCGGHRVGERYTLYDGTNEILTACKDCGGNMREESKDWISTADVLRWLDGIESVLR